MKQQASPHFGSDALVNGGDADGRMPSRSVFASQEGAIASKHRAALMITV